MSDNKKSSLSEALSGFATKKSLELPFESETRAPTVLGEISIIPKLDDVVSLDDDQPKKKKKKDKKGLGIDIGTGGLPGSDETAFLDDLMEDPMYDVKFDELIESMFDEDEDAELKNNLIALGRKHARMTGINDAETGEIEKAFSIQEQALDTLIEELGRDSLGAQRDIDMMRGLRTRNFKALADLVSAKNSINSTRLSAIKELSSITKNKFELRMKLKKGEGADGDTSAIASQAIQKLLGTGRGTLLSTIGGASVSAGARDTGSMDYDYDSSAEDVIADMDNDDDDEMDDGDMFIKHENDGVEYVVDFDNVDEDGTPTVYAIDKNDNIVTDYPLPHDIESLSFNINELTGTATDNLHRTYRVFKDGRFMAGS